MAAALRYDAAQWDAIREAIGDILDAIDPGRTGTFELVRMSNGDLCLLESGGRGRIYPIEAVNG